MADTYTTSNRLEKMEPGQYLDTWGSRMNAQGGSDLVDASLDGVEDFALSGSKTLTNNNGASDEARKRGLNITGGTGGTITIPNVDKLYFIRNGSSGDVVITTGSGTTTTIKTGLNKWVMCDGANNVYQASGPDFGSANIVTTGTLTTGAATVSSLASGAITGSTGTFSSTVIANNANIRSVTGTGVIEMASANGGPNILYSYTGSWPGGGQQLQFRASQIDFNTAGTILATITSSECRFQVGTTASAANAYIDNASNNRLLRSTSSAYYKTDIQDVEQQYLDAALSIRPVFYRSNPEHAPNDNPNYGHWGHIAEEVAAIDPRLVHWGYQDRDYETYTFEEPVTVETGELDDDGNPIIETVMEPREGRRLKAGAELRPDGAQYERINLLKIEALRRQNVVQAEQIAALTARLDAAGIA